MQNYFTYLNSESTSSVFPKKFSNEIYFSDGSNLYYRYESVYSIKCQLAGNEHYKVGEDYVDLKPGHYLIVNDKSEVTCLPSKSEKAISIFIEPELLADVFRNLKSSSDKLLSDPFDFQNNAPLFFEHTFNMKENILSRLLLKVSTGFSESRSGNLNFNIEFFFNIAEALIVSQQETFKQVQKIHCVKNSTKKELYKRMLLAEDYIQSNLQKPVSLFNLASAAAMSPYHFHRTFKAVFGESPSRFVRDMKLEQAKEMIRAHKLNISEIAEFFGYEDIFSFSKAFKKKFGIAPSKFRN